jgi:hypothetical protein
MEIYEITFKSLLFRQNSDLHNFRLKKIKAKNLSNERIKIGHQNKTCKKFKKKIRSRTKNPLKNRNWVNDTKKTDNLILIRFPKTIRHETKAN